MINELDLLWLPNFIALGIYVTLGTKFSWNEGIDTCFNVACVLLGCNFDFLDGYLVVTARYLVVTTGYCSLPGGYCSLLVVTARYRSLLLVVSFSMNAISYQEIIFHISVSACSFCFHSCIGRPFDLILTWVQ